MPLIRLCRNEYREVQTSVYTVERNYYMQQANEISMLLFASMSNSFCPEGRSDDEISNNHKLSLHEVPASDFARAVFESSGELACVEGGETTSSWALSRLETVSINSSSQ
jgi:hypothetical protein